MMVYFPAGQGVGKFALQPLCPQATSPTSTFPGSKPLPAGCPGPTTMGLNMSAVPTRPMMVPAESRMTNPGLRSMEQLSGPMFFIDKVTFTSCVDA